MGLTLKNSFALKDVNGEGWANMMIRVDDLPIVLRDKFRDLKHQSSPVRAAHEQYCGRSSGH